MTKRRRPSSRRWLKEHESDPYVLRARREGYRSRAAFKLEELDRRDHFLRPGLTVVDLGAAPGGWCQYLRRRFGDRIRVIGLDLLPVEPVEGVTFLQGDFRDEAVLGRLEALLGDAPVDLVLSDMAPNISGIGAADQAGVLLLAELALDFARRRLRAGGTLLVKAFQGEGFDAYLRSLRAAFEKVALRKPQASRARSSEVYLLAQRLRLV